jgi:hypothetical protein
MVAVQTALPKQDNINMMFSQVSHQMSLIPVLFFIGLYSWLMLALFSRAVSAIDMLFNKDRA